MKRPLESQRRNEAQLLQSFPSVPDILRNIFKIDVKRMLRNHYQIRLHGYDPSEGHEIILQVHLRQREYHKPIERALR